MTAGLRLGSLFSGCGGLDLGVNAVLGSVTAWHVEWYPPARRVLAAHYPGVPVHGDMAGVDWSAVPPVDVVTAGFPCTNVSLLGRREGLHPDWSTEHLFTRPSGWELTVRALRALRPALVILENVSALLTAPATAAVGDRPGSAFGAVLADLAGLGLDAEWVCVDASAAGAPHRRRRVLLAAADPERLGRGPRWDGHEEGGAPQLRWDDAAGGAGLDPRPADWLGPYTGALVPWAAVLGRPAPDPVVNRTRNPRLWEWLMGLPPGWLTPAGTVEEQLRVAGNAVVPQQVAAALPTLLGRLLEPATEVAA